MFKSLRTFGWATAAKLTPVEPMQTIQAQEHPRAIAHAFGGIAVSSGSNTVEFWRDQRLLLAGAGPSTVLHLKSVVYSLLSFGEFLAAGTGMGSIYIWTESLQDPQYLSTTHVSDILALLAWGEGVAAGALAVYVWPKPSPNTPIVAPMSLPSSGNVIALVKVGGRLVAGTFGSLDIWEAKDVRDQAQPSFTLLPPCGITTLAGVQGGLAAGLSMGSRVVFWPSEALETRNSSNSVSLGASDHVTILLLLHDRSLAAGTRADSVNIWHPAALEHGAYAPSAKLKGAGRVSALAQLYDGSIMAASNSVGRYNILLWPEETIRKGLVGSSASQLHTSGGALSLQNLPNGGLAASTDAQTINIWSKLGAEQDKMTSRLNVTQSMGFMQTLGNGGLAAGSSEYYFQLWMNETSVQRGVADYNFRDAIFLALPKIGPSSFAVAQHQGTGIRVWASTMLELTALGQINCLAALGAGLAAGTVGGIDLWQTLPKSNWTEPDRRLSAHSVTQMVLFDDYVAALAGEAQRQHVHVFSLSRNWSSQLAPVAAGGKEHLLAWSGGIAVSTVAEVIVWDVEAIAGRGPAKYLHAALSSHAFRAQSLRSGGIAVSSTTGLHLWPDSASVQQSPQSVAHLDTAEPVFSFLTLQDGGIAVGTQLSWLDLWKDPGEETDNSGLFEGLIQTAGAVYAVQTLAEGAAAGILGDDGPALVIFQNSQQKRLKLGGLPLSILQLADGRIAVGTNNKSVELWSIDPEVRHVLPLSGWGRALLQLGDALLVGTDGPYGLEVWNLRAAGSVSDGNHSSSASKSYASNSSNSTGSAVHCRMLLATVHAMAHVTNRVVVGTEVDLRIFDADVASCSGEGHQLHDSPVFAVAALPGGGLVAAGILYVLLWSADLTHPLLISDSLPVSSLVLNQGILATGSCVFIPLPCPAGTYASVTDRQKCLPCAHPWRSTPCGRECSLASEAHYLRSFGICLILGGCMFQLALWQERLKAVGSTLQTGLNGLSTVIMLISLASSLWKNKAANSILPLAGLAGSLAAFCSQTAAGHFLPLGVILLAASAVVMLLGEESHQPVFTIFGTLRPAVFWPSVALLPNGLALAAIANLTAWARKAPRMARSTEAGEFCEALTAVRQRGRDWESLAQVARTWMGQHMMCLALGVISVAQLSYHYHSVQVKNDARSGIVALAIAMAGLQILVSLHAVLSSRLPKSIAGFLLDRHMRYALICKKLCLLLKLAILCMPFQTVIDVNMSQKCVYQGFCPKECTDDGGICATNSESQCICMRRTLAELFTLINCFMSICTAFALTLADAVRFWRLPEFMSSVPRAERKLLAQVALACSLPSSQLCFLVLVRARCENLVITDAAALIYPGLLMVLLANEGKRALASWRERPPYSALWSDDFLRALQPWAALAAAFSAGHALQRGLHPPIQPLRLEAEFGVQWKLCWVAIAVSFAIGAVAALAIGPLSRGSYVS